MAVYEQGLAPMNGTARAGVFMQYAGAAVSLALVAGIGVWGYKLVMRDVTGIPVVRAMTGDIRVLPENPGGEVSLHTGLSVNAVAGEGGAAAPEDTVALAPQGTGLAAEDLSAQPMAEAAEVQPSVTPAPAADDALQVSLASSQGGPDKPLTTQDILALADQIAAGAAPLTALAEGTDVAPTMSVDGATVVPASFLPHAQLRVSMRPAMRPKRQETLAHGTHVATASAQVSTTRFAVGTSLVQLGAYPSADVAAKEWGRLTGRFGDVMSGKTQVIQQASSGGRTFYRLRANGFGDLADARRFCAALVAENADCIPVVVR